MNAAFMSYKESAGPESAVTGVRERLCGTTGTAARLSTPVHDENKLSSIVFSDMDATSTPYVLAAQPRRGSRRHRPDLLVGTLAQVFDHYMLTCGFGP